MSAREIELKYDLGNASSWQLMRQSLGAPLAVLQQHNHFFDSPDLVLSKARLALRLRLIDDRPAVLTLKGPALQVGDAKSRMEIESEINLSEARQLLQDPDALTRLQLAPIVELHRQQSVSHLLRLIGFRNERHCYAMPHPDRPEHRLELVLDCTTYDDGHREYEMELELWPDVTEAQVSAADAMARELLRDAQVQVLPQHRSKLRRAIERAV